MDSRKPLCLRLPSAGITGVSDHAQLVVLLQGLTFPSSISHSLLDSGVDSAAGESVSLRILVLNKSHRFLTSL